MGGSGGGKKEPGSGARGEGAEARLREGPGAGGECVGTWSKGVEGTVSPDPNSWALKSCSRGPDT